MTLKEVQEEIERHARMDNFVRLEFDVWVWPKKNKHGHITRDITMVKCTHHDVLSYVTEKRLKGHRVDIHLIGTVVKELEYDKWHKRLLSERRSAVRTEVNSELLSRITSSKVSSVK